MQAAGIQLRLYGAWAELVKVIFDLCPLHPLFAVTVQKTIGNNHIKFWLFMQKCNNNKVIFLRVSLVYFKYACIPVVQLHKLEMTLFCLLFQASFQKKK